MRNTIFRFIGIALFVYILSRIDFSELTLAFLGINFFYYALAMIFLVFWFFIRTLKWKALVDSAGIDIDSRPLAGIMAKGVFLGVVTPGKLGEFWRAKYLAQGSPTPLGRAFYTALMDRLLDLLVLIFVSLIGLIVIYLKFDLGLLWGVYIVCFSLLLLAALLFLKKIGLKRIIKTTVNLSIPSVWREKTNNFLEEFNSGLKTLKARLFFEVVFYSFFYYLSAVFVYYFYAKALGILLPFWYLFLVLAMVWLILTLPLTILGLGTREAGFIYFLSIIGVSASQAVAFSLLALTANILLAIPGLIIFLWKK